MQEEHINSPNIFVGVMDLENDLTVVSNQDYLYALGIRNGKGGIPGVATHVKGNCLVAYDLPAGQNICIGKTEDKRCSSIIYYIYNSNNDHQILRYYPQKKDVNHPCGKIELVACGEVLNFKSDWLITHDASFIDNKFLHWTDGYTEKDFIEGNPPRKINAEQSNVTGKNLIYEVHVDIAATFLETTLTDDLDLVFTTVTVQNQIETIDKNDVNAFVGDPVGFLEFLKDRLENPINPNIPVQEVEFCDCKLTITTQAQGDNPTVLIFRNNGPDDSTSDFLLVPINHLGVTANLSNPGLPLVCNLKEQHISLIKRPPKCEPMVSHILDPSVNSNNVNNNVFQFRTRYLYRDGEKSKWSAISNISSPLDVLGNFLDLLNAIEIDFTEDILNDPYWRTMIFKVEIAFRIGNTGLFKSIDVLDICDIGLKKNSLNFYNDNLYSTVPSDENGSADLQVLGHYDFVPLICGGMETVSDSKDSGNNRLFLSANLENYDKPDCVELEFEADETFIDECLITIKGTVTIDTTGIPNHQIYLDSTSNNFGYLDDGIMWTQGIIFDPFSNRWVGGANADTDYEQQLDGFVVYLAGTDYYGVSKNSLIVPNVDRDGSFEIKNVPKGRYILRVAHFNVVKDDSQGAIHNLSNGRSYQRTSAPVINCAGSVSATSIAYERNLDLTNSSVVFDLDTEVGYGPIEIANIAYYPVPITSPAPNDFRGALQGYLLDNGADASDQDIRKGAIAQERQKVFLQVLTQADGFGFEMWNDRELITDHNGYWYFTWNFQKFPGPLFPIPNRIREMYPTVPDVCNATPGLFRNLSVVDGTGNKYSGDMYNSGFQGLWDSPTIPEFQITYQPNGQIHFIANSAQTWLMFNKDVEFTDNNKTLVRGSAIDTASLGLKNVLVTIQRNGRQENTDFNGNYAIAVYCPWDKEVRDDDLIIPNYLLDKCAQNLPTPSDILLDIDEFCDPYNSSNPYIASNFIYPNIGPLASGDKYLKSGGVYDFGIVYEDEYGRQATVSKAKKTLRIPFHTVYGFYEPLKIKWSITSLPPIWATKFRLVRTKESYYRRYIHELIEVVTYVLVDDINQSPITTSFENGNATHIMIKVSSLLGLPDSNSITWFFKGEEENNFEPEQRDRIRFILNQEGNIVGSGSIIDARIEGIYVENDDYFYVIENQETYDKILPGWLIEIYTPKKIEETVYYEIGECHEILDAKTANRRHSGPTNNQNIGLGQAAEGYLVGGDTYWRTRDFGVSEGVSYNNKKVENSNVNDRFDSTHEDIGRANVVDNDFGQRFYYNRVRFSQLFVPNSKLNGLSSYRGTDYQDLDVKFGIVKRIIAVDMVLLAICEFKIQPIYIGKDNLMDLSGNSSVGRSDRIMALANELKENLGTMNPESIVEYQGWVYGWDVYKGVMWRYSSNGVFPISSYKAQTYFNNLGEKLLDQDRKITRAFGALERKYSCYLVTFYDDGSYLTNDEAKTISFSEGKNGFNCFQPFVAENYAMVGNLLVSFKNGNLWVHESDLVPHNNFYDTQYTSKIQPVCNDVSKAVKIAYNIELQADNLWFASLIEIPKNYQYPLGMRSRLKAGNWSNTEGTWKADFLRDMNDPSPDFASITPVALKEATALLRGRPLRFEVMSVLLELNNPEELSILRRMDIEHNLSNDTKT